MTSAKIVDLISGENGAQMRYVSSRPYSTASNACENWTLKKKY